MPGVTFTLLIGFAPAPPEVVEAVQQIEIEASTDVASVCRLRLGSRRQCSATGRFSKRISSVRSSR